jgi:hypothetical protein
VDAPSAVLVDGRGRSRTVGLFRMRCDGQQLPESLDGERVRLYRARGTFTGKASAWNEGSPGAGSPASAEGRTALGIGGGRVFGILTPDLVAEPCVWFTLPLRTLRVVEHGSQGLFKKRPVSVQIWFEDWSIRLSGVNIIIPASGGRQTPKQEATLVKALKGA